MSRLNFVTCNTVCKKDHIDSCKECKRRVKVTRATGDIATGIITVEFELNGERFEVETDPENTLIV